MIFIDLQSLIIDQGAIGTDAMLSSGWEERVDSLISRGRTISTRIKNFLTFEAEPYFISNPPQSTLSDAKNFSTYPDLTSGSQDCVAHTSLIMTDKVLRILFHMKLRYGCRSQEALEATLLLELPEVIEGWKKRAWKAFEFVREQSEIAAKPLAAGLQSIQVSGRLSVDGMVR